MTSPVDCTMLELVSGSLGGMKGFSDVTTIVRCFTGETGIVKVLADSKPLGALVIQTYDNMLDFFLLASLVGVDLT